MKLDDLKFLPMMDIPKTAEGLKPRCIVELLERSALYPALKESWKPVYAMGVAKEGSDYKLLYATEITSEGDIKFFNIAPINEIYGCRKL